MKTTYPTEYPNLIKVTENGKIIDSKENSNSFIYLL